MANLFIVPTPLGNLGDITLRALDVLKSVPVILSEDTRVTRKLLTSLKINYKDKKILNYFEHNEREKLEDVLAILDGGYDVALVSDAGTPLINDPGFPLVRSIRELKKDVNIVVLPGASAVLCALAASGLPTDRFTFLGYVPRKPNDKKKMLKAVKRASENIKSTYIAFETKHRIESTLLMMKLILGGSTPLSVCKELTKINESVEYGTIQDAVERISSVSADDLKGEYVLVFGIGILPMNEETWQKVEEAAEESIKHPGANKKPLPKDKVKKGQHFILIFRHGESTDNVKKLFSGWRDPDLTEKGRRQALALAPKLKELAAKGLDLELVITSDQIRSKETAKLALSHYPEIIKWEEDWRIKERNYGDLAGRSKEEAMCVNPKQAIKWRRGYDSPPPNGESLQMVEKRVEPFLKELVKRVQAEHIDVALSMHGNSMRVARKFFEKMDLVEELTHENPLGIDYALYVIRS